MNRRRALSVVGTVGLTGVAGCLGEEGFEYVASQAAIPAAGSHGYEVEGPESIEFDETLEVGGVEQDVHIRTWSATYLSPDNESSLFLFSTPDVSVAGVSANPLARLGGADLVVRVLNEGLGGADAEGGIQNVEADGEIELSVLNEQRTVSLFSATFETDGLEQANENGEIPVSLYVLSTAHEDDVILAVGLHPKTVDAADDIHALMEGIEHPVS